MKIRDRVKEFRRVKASELLPNPKNWRTHPAAQMDALRGVLSEVGFAGAELAYETEHGLMLIDGHARAELAGEQEVPVLILDVNESEAAKLLATFDPIGAMAGADKNKLESILREVQTSSEGLSQMLADLHDQHFKDKPERESQDTDKLDKAIQLEPGKEYCLIMADNEGDWEEMRQKLDLNMVRRGGYKKGSAFDAVGTQRVLKWSELKELLK